MTAAVPDDPPALARIERLARSVTEVVAPLGLLTAMLFYFGYASSRAQYDYFGLDVDTVGLTTQDYVMRSPQPLLTPMLALLVCSVGATRLHGRLRRRIDAAVAAHTAAKTPATGEPSEGEPPGDEPSDPDPSVGTTVRRYEHRARLVARVGASVLVTGALLLAAYPLVGRWPPYPLLTPLTIAVGAALVGYAGHLRGLLDPGRPRRSATAVVVTAAAASGVFWAVATFAEWSGRGAGMEVARHLDELPGVILDTKERLHLTMPGIEETVLPPAPGQAFQFRYRKLRLLIQGRDRLFLVPDTWSASNSTLMVPMNDSTRLQFRFRNQSPV